MLRFLAVFFFFAGAYALFLLIDREVSPGVGFAAVIGTVVGSAVLWALADIRNDLATLRRYIVRREDEEDEPEREQPAGRPAHHPDRGTGSTR